jgi:hypothetical protein
VGQPTPDDDGARAEEPSFLLLDDAPAEPAEMQVLNVLPRIGAVYCAVPPGACKFAFCSFLCAFFTGRTSAPFGMARYPGDVMFSTSTPLADRSMRAAHTRLYRTTYRVFTQITPHRFDWREPGKTLEPATKEHASAKLAAVIIDAGPVARGLSDATVNEANGELVAAATEAQCLVIIIVETTSRKADPFERIPAILRAMPNKLLVVPLRRKVLNPEPGAPAEFLLMHLSDTAPNSLAVHFSLLTLTDHVDIGSISWQSMIFEDPREVFRRADSADLTSTHRLIVNVAVEVIQRRGPTSKRDIDTAVRLRLGLASSTTSEALSAARLCNYLDVARDWQGRWFWFVVGVTKLPYGMTSTSARGGDEVSW